MTAAEIAEKEQFKQLDGFKEERNESIPLNRLNLIRKLAPRFRDDFMKTGSPLAVKQFTCSVSPYPTVYGFHTAYSGLHPYLYFNNRATLVQFKKDGRIKNLLFNPIFPELSEQAPFYDQVKAKLPSFLPEALFARRERSLIEQLKKVGVEPEDIDYLSYDHLHVQDMRPLMGTVDSNGKQVRKPLFPNALFIFHEDEWESVVNLHPTVKEWYVEGAIDNVDTRNLYLYRGDLLLSDGVALVHTPGHTPGMHALYLNTPEGTLTLSENAVGPDAYNPENSRVAGLRDGARAKGWEVILNANTIDMRFDQYNSVVKEKILSGPAPANPDFCNHRPTSEFTTWMLTPGLEPTFEHGDLNFGRLQKK